MSHPKDTALSRQQINMRVSEVVKEDFKEAAKLAHELDLISSAKVSKFILYLFADFKKKYGS